MGKGISYLLASVLLISIAVAIAIVMSNWSKFFSEERLDTSAEGVRCMGALGISAPLFSNTSINITVSNTNDKINLVGLNATVTYPSGAEKIFGLNVTNSTLKPGEKINLLIDTSNATKPKKIEVVASNCRDATAYMNFK